MGSSGAHFCDRGGLVPDAQGWIDVGYLAIFPFSLPFGVIKRPEHWVYWFIRWDHQYSRRVGDCTGADVGILGPVLVGVELDEPGAPAELMCGIAAVLLLPGEITMKKRYALRWL